MTRLGFENLTISLKSEIKHRFEELFQQEEANSKGEFLANLMDRYTDEPDPILPQPIKETLKEDEILVRLNPVQIFALKSILNLKQYFEVSNQQIAEHMKKTSVWTGELRFPNFFTLYDPTADPKVNLGILLINVFMASICNGAMEDVISYDEIRNYALNPKKNENSAE